MATVEELRGKVFRIVDYSWQHTGLEETLDSLIAAAREEGTKEVQGGTSTSKEHDSAVYVARDRLLGLTQESQKCNVFEWEAALKSLEAALLAQGRAEGAEQERERIIRGSERLPEGTDVETSEYFGIAYGVHEDNVLANSEVFIVPASALSPAPKEER